MPDTTASLTGTSLCTYAIEPPCTERYAQWCERSGLFRPLLLDWILRPLPCSGGPITSGPKCSTDEAPRRYPTLPFHLRDYKFGIIYIHCQFRFRISLLRYSVLFSEDFSCSRFLRYLWTAPLSEQSFYSHITADGKLSAPFFHQWSCDFLQSEEGCSSVPNGNKERILAGYR